MRFRVTRTWAVGISFLVASIQAGCVVSPATQPSGLPRISRYTNPLQLEWALSRYAALAAPTVGSAADLTQQACQGWRRMAFDLASARMFPRAFRMSAENAGLMAALDELPQAMSRHPLPSACATPTANASQAPSQPPPAPPSATQTPPTAQGTAVAQATDQSTITNGVSPTQTAPAAESAAAPAAAAPAVASAPQPAMPAQEVANARPAAPAVAVAVAIADPQDAASQEWQRLLTASAVKIAGQADWLGTDAGPNLEALGALAESSIPEIRLRARYHLLGHCANATVQQERLGKAIAVTQTGCWGNHGQEPLHVTQSRLLRSMLSAWRFRGPEPMSDLVVALASFASRDNPVLDGPRISR